MLNRSCFSQEHVPRLKLFSIDAELNVELDDTQFEVGNISERSCEQFSVGTAQVPFDLALRTDSTVVQEYCLTSNWVSRSSLLNSL